MALATAPDMTRLAVTTTSPSSGYVTAGAIRLFTAGCLAKLRYTGGEDGHLYFSIPSESQPGMVYQIDYHPARRTLRCSCPAGQRSVPCKHVRLYQLSRGFVTEEGRA